MNSAKFCHIMLACLLWVQSSWGWLGVGELPRLASLEIALFWVLASLRSGSITASQGGYIMLQCQALYDGQIKH